MSIVDELTTVVTEVTTLTKSSAFTVAKEVTTQGVTNRAAVTHFPPDGTTNNHGTNTILTGPYYQVYAILVLGHLDIFVLV